jgi:hypothetical protein
MKLDYNVQMIGYGLFILAVFVAIVKVGPPSEKISRDDLSDGETVKVSLGDCPRGSSRLPEIEVKKFHSFVNSEYINSYGQPRVYIGAYTDWNIDSVHVLFEIEYLDGTTRQEILGNKEIILNSDRIIVFLVKEEDRIKYFSDVKKFNYRVVAACGKLRPMKIEIKMTEAFKKIEKGSNEAWTEFKKEFTDLFSR